MHNITQNIKTFVNSLLVGSLLATSVGLIAAPSVLAASDASREAVCEGIGANSTSAGCDEDAADDELNTTITSVINILSIVAGVIAVIMLIVAGIKYALASGDPANINSAKNTLIYALVGLVVVVFAQVLVKFVLDKAA